jgi:hypothetical protein
VISTGKDASLYVLKDYPLHESPLTHFIEDGLIVLEEKDVKLHLTVQKKMKINYYDRYTFYRDLLDKRKYVNGVPKTKAKEYKLNENDCLKFGECLTLVNQTRDLELFEFLIKKGTSPPVLQSKATKLAIGEGYDEHEIFLTKLKELEDKNGIDNHASPKEGEAYGMIRKEGIVGKSDYHIAFVLYRDDKVNITLEANADQGATYRPAFGLYDIAPNYLYTFYRQNVGAYENGMTIVLEKRDLHQVEKEMNTQWKNRSIRLASASTKSTKSKSKSSTKSTKSKSKSASVTRKRKISQLSNMDKIEVITKKQKLKHTNASNSYN